MKTPPAGREHVTIAVSGANGGKTVDFRRFAQRGMTLLGLTESYENGRLFFADDLQANIRDGDKTYLGLLAEADNYITANQLDFPAEEDAKLIPQDPDCLKQPIRQLDIDKADLRTIIFATGYKQDFGWLAVDCFDKQGRPDHVRGVSRADGVYFLGLPWLSMRGSSFIWSVWEDAGTIAKHIASRSRHR